MALSPAPVGSVGSGTLSPRTSVGCSSSIQIPRLPAVTKTGFPVRLRSSAMAALTESSPRTPSASGNPQEGVFHRLAALTLMMTFRKVPIRRRLSAQKTTRGYARQGPPASRTLRGDHAAFFLFDLVQDDHGVDPGSILSR